MEKLTQFQADLICQLKEELTRLNFSKNSENKFSSLILKNCLNEKKAFIDSIYEYNKTAVKLLTEQAQKEIEEFNEEFKEFIFLDSNFSRFRNSQHFRNQGTLFNMAEQNEKTNPSRSNYLVQSETILYFISKINFDKYGDENYFNNANYFKYYLDFDRQRVSVEIESGESVTCEKIVGLKYTDRNWTCERTRECYNTLAEMLQKNNNFKQNLVRLASPAPVN